MRKLLILLGFVMVVYHFNSRASDEFECARQTCLISNETQIGFYEYPQRNGEVGLALSTRASLEDVLTTNSNNCYKGDVSEIVKIISSLSGNSEYNYSRGGHLYIKYFNVIEMDKDLAVIYEVAGDYPSYTVRVLIKKCES